MKPALLTAACALAALGAPVGALSAQPAPETDPETTAAAPESEALRFTVETIGEGARDVILIPGLMSPREVWRGQVDTLVAAGARVHLVEIAGFGGSDPGANVEGPVLPVLVEALARHIETQGREKVRLVGHSMGGFTALALALDRPDLVEEIMIVDSLPFFPVIMGMDSVEAARPQAAALRDMMVSQAGMDLPRPDCANPSAQARGMAKDPQAQCQVDRWAAGSDFRVGGHLMHDLMTTDLRPRLPELAVPVTMLYPVDPPAVTREAAAAIYPVQYAGTPDIAFVPVEGARHFLMLDRPEAMNAALARFVAD
jgi:pimeloyl-ACP methyl ester carboxylesterase